MSNQNTILEHKRIVVTRAACQADSLSGMLREAGADPIELPLIEFRPLLTVNEAQHTLSKLDEFDWIIFTSSNAIRFFFELLGGQQIPDCIRLACVGGKTASTLAEFSRRPDFVPARFSGRDLADEMEVIAGQKILYPSPKEVASNLAGSLEAKGAVVVRWPIYETVPVRLKSSDLQMLKAGIDVITFASPSVVDSFCEQFPDYALMLDECIVACIGPMTKQRACERDLRVDVIPTKFDIPGLVDAIIEHFDSKISRGQS